MHLLQAGWYWGEWLTCRPAGVPSGMVRGILKRDVKSPSCSSFLLWVVCSLGENAAVPITFPFSDTVTLPPARQIYHHLHLW